MISLYSGNFSLFPRVFSINPHVYDLDALLPATLVSPRSVITLCKPQQAHILD